MDVEQEYIRIDAADNAHRGNESINAHTANQRDTLPSIAGRFCVIQAFAFRSTTVQTGKSRMHPSLVNEHQIPRVYCETPSFDEEGQQVNTAPLPVTNDGTFGDVEPFMQLVQLGINQAKQVLLLADGAEWIWLRIPPLLKSLGCPPESIIELLDFYHAAKHLQQFADAAFTKPTVAQIWFKQARSEMKRGLFAS